jgi:hypothetical protein
MFIEQIMYAFLTSPTLAIFPGHFVLLPLIAQIIFVEEYRDEAPQLEILSAQLLLRSQCNPQHSVLKHPQYIKFFRQSYRPVADLYR